MADHKHDYGLVQFAFGSWWECACGYRPAEDEWNAWRDSKAVS